MFWDLNDLPKVLLYVSGLFKIDHAISFARMIVLAPNFGGPVGAPILFTVMSSCNVVNNAV